MTAATFTESIVEEATLELLDELGYGVVHGKDFAPGGLPRLRVLVKRLLRKYGYPPVKEKKATETVLQQAELICKDWAYA